MKGLNKLLKHKNIGCGYLYFYIHFVTEIVCFYFLSYVTNGSKFIWLIPFIYDGLAFVPQSLIGHIKDLYPKLRLDYIGIGLLFVSIFMLSFMNVNVYLMLLILCLGNCFLHISGAEITLRNSGCKLSDSAIFVSGGSFGVICGKLLATTNIPSYLLLVLILTMIPFVMLANSYDKNNEFKKFNYVKKKGIAVVLIALFVVIIRGYMGYGIPTQWNKTILQTVILYVTMGLGKALGGILSDRFGIKKIATISTLLSIPFLCFGNNYMIISLLGVMLFSMTMPITLGILTSILNPGLAFGVTTIGLFIGTAFIFFIKITNSILNISLIVLLSILCYIMLMYVLSGDDKNG